MNVKTFQIHEKFRTFSDIIETTVFQILSEHFECKTFQIYENFKKDSELYQTKFRQLRMSIDQYIKLSYFWFDSLSLVFFKNL